MADRRKRRASVTERAYGMKAPQVTTQVMKQAGYTTLTEVSVRVADERRQVWLKLEADNPSGSVKYRTAMSLIRLLEETGRLEREPTLIESTSGNLGVALALAARQRGLRFYAVVDPKMPRALLQKMQMLGAAIDVVEEPDAQGSYLASRIARVMELVASSSDYVWTNQYESPANPAAHARGTGPELWLQSNGEIDAVFIAVSTGGTLAGVAGYLREVAPRVRVIAVDAVGSAALGGEVGSRLLTGIGSSRKSSFIQPQMCDAKILVSDTEAFSMCRALSDSLGILVGGSSGATLAACVRYLATHPEVRCPACLCADDGRHYLDTIFDEEWLDQHDLYPLEDQRWRFERC